MELDLLDKKIRRLVCKLKKHNADIEVFEHDDIEYGETLGKGGEGIVQKCVVKYNNLPVDAAVKTLLDNSDDAISITLDEIELLCLGQDLVVDTTVRVYGLAAVPDDDNSEMGQLAIIMEAGITSCLKLFQDQEIPLHVTFSMWSRIAAAIHMLHVRKIIHQDLKPENILITAIRRNANGVIHQADCKIIDLGMGKRVFTEKVITDDILGTNGYHPPEVLAEEDYDFRADIFMLGITFCVLLHTPTFLKKNLTDLLKRIHAAKKRGLVGQELYETLLEPTMDRSNKIPSQIKSMLCTMVEHQSERNISLVEIAELCREHATSAAEEDRHDPPKLSPSVNSQDSGFSSGDQSAISSVQQAKRRLRRLPGRRNASTSEVSARQGKSWSLRSGSSGGSVMSSGESMLSSGGSVGSRGGSGERILPMRVCRKRKVSRTISSSSMDTPLTHILPPAKRTCRTNSKV